MFEKKKFVLSTKDDKITDIEVYDQETYDKFLSFAGKECFLREITHRGGFHYDTKVLLANRETKSIGWIVENKYAGDVWTKNLKTGSIEAKPIIKWFCHGTTESWIRVEVLLHENNKSFNIYCEDHSIITKKGKRSVRTCDLDEALIYCNTDGREKNSLVTIEDVFYEDIFDVHTGRYDIAVADNANYFAGGVLVHDSSKDTYEK